MATDTAQGHRSMPALLHSPAIAVGALPASQNPRGSLPGCLCKYLQNYSDIPRPPLPLWDVTGVLQPPQHSNAGQTAGRSRVSILPSSGVLVTRDKYFDHFRKTQNSPRNFCQFPERVSALGAWGYRRTKNLCARVSSRNKHHAKLCMGWKLPAGSCLWYS